MKKYLILLSSLWLFAAACRDVSCDGNERLLHNCSYKYWELYKTNRSMRIGCYRFDVDGTCIYMRYDRETGKRSQWIDGDVRSYYRYFIRNDSLFIDNKPTRIIVMNEELIIKEGNSIGCREDCYSILVPSKDQRDDR